MSRRRMPEAERKELATRLRACKATYGLKEHKIAQACQVDQPFINRLMLEPLKYRFETPKVARVLNYVKMQESDRAGVRIQLPFETTGALRRFLAAEGDIELLNLLINVLATRASVMR